MSDRSRHIALLIGSPAGGLEGVPSNLHRMRTLLAGWKFDSIIECRGAEAKRAQILAHLEELRADARPDDTIVVYYNGHGGRCQLDAGDNDGGSTLSNFLVPMDEDWSTTFHGITDFELTILFHDISEKTKNVTAIFDCCHASTMVRDGEAVAQTEGDQLDDGPAPETRPDLGGGHVRTMPEDMKRRYREYQDRQGELHPGGNPHVVRVVATAAGAPAFEDTGGETNVGYLTAELCDVLEQVRGKTVSWDTIIRRVREGIIEKRGSIVQRANVEGPRRRRPFSLETEDEALERATLTYRKNDGSAWILAGKLQGLHEHDQLQLLDDDGNSIVSGHIEEVFKDTARVSFEASTSLEARKDLQGRIPRGSAASFASYNRRHGVCLDPSANSVGGLAEVLRAQPRLRLVKASENPSFTLRRGAHGIEVDGPPGYRRLPHGESKEQLVRLARDINYVSRGLLLREELSDVHGLSETIDWRVEISGDPSGERAYEPLHDNQSVPAGTSIRIQITHASRAKPVLHVNVLNVGISGRVSLLSDLHADGVHLPPAEESGPITAQVPADTDLLLEWPNEVPRDSEMVEEFIFVASQRPLDLRGLLTPSLGASRSPLMRTGPTRKPLWDTDPDTRFGSGLFFDVKRFRLRLRPPNERSAAATTTAPAPPTRDARTARPEDPPQPMTTDPAPPEPPNGPVLLVATANTVGVGEHPLRALDMERENIRTVLGSHARLRVFPDANIQTIWDAFNEDGTKESIQAFHFAGHATGSWLAFADAFGSLQKAHAGGFADFLGSHPSLVLVFLNGCSTKAQVEALRNAGIPAVIATTDAIDDVIAAEFAKRFYAELRSDPLEKAFFDTLNYMKTRHGHDARSVVRDAVRRTQTQVGWPWSLDCDEVAKTWRLGDALPEIRDPGWEAEVENELISKFNDGQLAHLLATKAGFPVSLLPQFTMSLIFWSQVCQAARDGVLPNGLQPLVDTASQLLPHNPVFEKYKTR